MKEFDDSSDNIKRTIDADYFERNKKLLNLINLLQQQNSQMIAIDGSWGTGKTVFIHQLKHLIENKKYRDELLKIYNISYSVEPNMQCVYFNSWENDAINNPSITLLYDLVNHFKLFDVENKEKYNSLLDITTNLVLRTATLGAIGIKDFYKDRENIYKEILSTKNIKKKINDIIDNLIKTSKSEKIILIIDELDRCRPTYAINMLETIKHYYDNKKLIFLVATNMEQLANTVKRLYGEQYDGDLYLQRFFTTKIILNMPSIDEYIKKELKFNLKNYSAIENFCKTFIIYNDMKIRDINYFIGEMKLKEDEIASPNGTYNNFSIAKLFFSTCGISLKHKNATQFHLFRSGNFKLESFEDIVIFDTSYKSLINNYFNGIQINANIPKILFDWYKAIFTVTPLDDIDRDYMNITFNDHDVQLIIDLIDL